MGAEFMSAAMKDVESSILEYPVEFNGNFGWFSAGVSERAVILCGTLGFEQLSAHRAWRELAAQIAGAGCAVLRFDYPGEGDSLDIDPRRLDNFTNAIFQAVMFLRTEAEAKEIVLVGLRLGATLAALVAANCNVDGLALLAPFTSGRAYLREMRLRATTIDHLPDGTPIPQKADELLLGSFRLHSSLIVDISKIDLFADIRAPAPRVLIIGSDTKRLAQRYKDLGCEVSTDLFPELANLLVSDMFSETPTEAFKHVTNFVIHQASLSTETRRTPAPASQINGPGWSERPRQFGHGMFGVLCRPEHSAADTPIILFIGSGRNPHSGRGRQIVALSRKLAQSGVSSFRFDLLGIGDSVERRDGSSPLYSLDAVNDVRAVIDHLQASTQNPVMVVGFCSGAFLAFHAICRDERISAAVLVNLFCFDWNPSYDLETMMRNPNWGLASYAAQAKSRASWSRLFRDPKRILSILMKLSRLAGRVSKRSVKNIFQKVNFQDTVSGRIDNVRKRGASLAFIFSENEPGMLEVYRNLGHDKKKVEDIIGGPIVVIDKADHNLANEGVFDEFDLALRGIIQNENAKLAAHNRREHFGVVSKV
ncbi:alpha/beta fold hydrolase [Methylobacterium mesophilicum]|nr:alpha/beta fold hydrolase [Methylobacterium mesophilicum]